MRASSEPFVDWPFSERDLRHDPNIDDKIEEYEAGLYEEQKKLMSIIDSADIPADTPLGGTRHGHCWGILIHTTQI
jgi:hypothetical protein